MRRIALIAFFLSVVLPFAAADEWNKTYTVSARPDVRISSSDAALRVSAWDQNTVRVRVYTEGYKIGDGGIRIIEHQTGNVVEVEVKYPHEHGLSFSWHNKQVEVDVQMPREGNAALHTGDGSIRLSGIHGDMELDTGDGSVEATDVEGQLKARSGDGHVTVVGRFTALDLNTGDGRIDATVQPASKPAKDWSIHTGDGSVTLRVPENLAVDLDIHTSDGHINSDVPITTSGRLGENSLRGKMNGGGPVITVRTGDGSIHLERS